MPAKYVYFFGGGSAEGDGTQKDLLGGKGAGLAEMSRLGIPVPPGFTLTTEVCGHYQDHRGGYPDGLEAQVEEHATSGAGFLVLAHPPGIGKGYNTTLGLKRWLASSPTGDDGSGYLVWTALRKAQIDDQQGIPLIPLHGRGPQNCRKLPEAQPISV